MFCFNDYPLFIFRMKFIFYYVSMCLCAFLLSGCLGLNRKAKPVHFYVLHSIEKTSCVNLPEVDFPGGLGIGVVELPEYLKTDKLVTRVSLDELEYSDYNRWAEPLATGLTRTLAENIRRLTHLSQVSMAPWRVAEGHAYVLNVLVEDATLNAGGSVVLSARWILQEGSRICFTGEEIIEQKVPDQYAHSYAAALSDIWGLFAARVALKLVDSKPLLGMVKSSISLSDGF